jgi:hypothetical protein
MKMSTLNLRLVSTSGLAKENPLMRSKGVEGDGVGVATFHLL